MKHRLIVRSCAERDISEACHWYQQQAEGLGSDCLRCVDAAIAFIGRNPLTFPKHYHEYRRVLVRRFPYGIFYVVEGDIISVIAVLHLAQDPETIRKILNERQ